MANEGRGGFMVNPLPSPAPSQASSLAAFSDNDKLPIARSHPLKAGSQKEILFINHVDAKILNINRRYAKKFTGEVEEGVGRGYDTFSELVDDLNVIFDIVWISSTPSLQVPYLLSLATLLCSCLPAFSFSPEPTFLMIEKLDTAFSSLLQGPPITTSTVGNRQRIVSLTDQVRIRSITELTRVTVVDKLSSFRRRHAQNDASSPDEITEDEGPNDIDGGAQDNLMQSVSRLYVNTIDLLGDSLVSDDRARD